MDRSEQLTILSGVAADQWGLVTAAQAKDLGLSGVQLLRLAEAGLLGSVGRGVYVVPSAGLPEHLEIKVAWLRLQPQVPAWQRPLGGRDSGVVSHGSACRLHGLGDIPAPKVEISVPRRRTTTETFVRLRTAPVDPADITVVDGLPVTAPARTIVDLLSAKADGGHIGGVIADAERRDLLDIDELAELVQPYARLYGLPSAADGHQLVEHMVEQAGRELHSQEIARAGREGFAAAALLAAQERHIGEAFADAAALEPVLRSLAAVQHAKIRDLFDSDAFEPVLQRIAAQQVSIRDALNKAMPNMVGASALQEAMRNLQGESAMQRAIKDLAISPGLLQSFHQASLPKSGFLSPEIQRAFRQAATIRPTVAQAVGALRELEQASSDRATAAADGDESAQGEEAQNRLNDIQNPE